MSSTEYKKVEEAKSYNPGFAIGADALFFSEKKLSLVFGVSLSQTKGEYHSSFISEGPTSRTGYTKLTRVSENDYAISFTALNFQAGVRARIRDKFFLVPSFVLNSPLKIKRVLNGYTKSTFSNNSGGEDSDIIYFKDETTVLSQKAANISFRLQGEYEFNLGSKTAGIYVYRNFGLFYALPWWSFGFYYRF